jgi:hypothetical protein
MNEQAPAPIPPVTPPSDSSTPIGQRGIDAVGQPTVTVKEDPSKATYLRTAVATGLAASPIVTGDVILYFFTVIHAFLDKWPVPTAGTCTNIGVFLATIGVAWTSFGVRGTKQIVDYGNEGV